MLNNRLVRTVDPGTYAGDLWESHESGDVDRFTEVVSREDLKEDFQRSLDKTPLRSLCERFSDCIHD